MKKITVEITAEYIDWNEVLEKLNEIVSETFKEVSSIEISYSDKDKE